MHGKMVNQQLRPKNKPLKKLYLLVTTFVLFIDLFWIVFFTHKMFTMTFQKML